MKTEVTIVLRSGTIAMKAERLLGNAGIYCSVVRPGPEKTGNGCGYGVRVSAPSLERALRILKNAGITPGRTF